MFQGELFSDIVQRSGKFLGSGCFSTAYEISPGLVMKVGVNDMTRNWLEFCMWRTQAKTLLPMMPEVYSVIELGEHRYSATMPKFATLPSSTECGCEALKLAMRGGEFLNCLDAFNDYLTALGHKAIDLFDDVHSDNIMVREDGGLVLTDPCSVEYLRPVSSSATLNLTGG